MNSSDSEYDSDGDIHGDARPSSTVAHIADWGSQKYQHADIATGYDAQLVRTNTDGSISLQCNSCDWATDILKPSKARQKLKAHEFKHSSRIIEKDEQISNKSAIIPEQGVISQGQYSAWLNDPDVQIKLLDGSISTFAELDRGEKLGTGRDSLNSSDSEYEGNDLSSNVNHESDSDFYLNPYIDSDGDIHYGDARPSSTTQLSADKVELEMFPVMSLAPSQQYVQLCELQGQIFLTLRL